MSARIAAKSAAGTDRFEGRFAAEAAGVLEAVGGRLAEHGDGAGLEPAPALVELVRASIGWATCR